MDLFAKINLQFKAVDNFDKKLYFKIYYGVLNLPRLSFQIYIYLDLHLDLFICPKTFKIN